MSVRFKGLLRFPLKPPCLREVTSRTAIQQVVIKVLPESLDDPI
jgi:hypothetical protein